ncbi:hypothetical protein AeNC1_017303, partial [Aphanomyces euteiches]
MTDLPPHLRAGINRINAALEVAIEMPPPATGTLRVCVATEEEWNAFVHCDGQVVRPNYLEWFTDSGEIHIIEFVSTPHAKYIWRLSKPFHEDHIERWLIGHLDASNSQGPQACPDLSFGPNPETIDSELPPGVPDFDDFRTIKIEIGVSQPWGMAQGQLDHKAIDVWAQMPGVEYVLCVKFDPDFANAEYKLYDVRVNLDERDPLPIAAPSTIVQFDGHRILGIPEGMPLPVGFPKTLSVDLGNGPIMLVIIYIMLGFELGVLATAIGGLALAACMLVGFTSAAKVGHYRQNILKEATSGTRNVHAKFSYVSQESWIQHASVKQNILFDSALDDELYRQVVAACQLHRDFSMLPKGDETEIGERGLNLSGGQKARVSLARAIYHQEADVYLLDDPLSALDVHVANSVFRDGVRGLLGGKTTVLVLTSHYHLLSHADRILLMSDGSIIGDGSYDDIVAKFPHLMNMMLATKVTSFEDQEEQQEDDKKTAKSESTLVAKEDNVKGQISWTSYKSYL